MCGGKSGEFVIFPGAILIIIIASFSICIKIWIVIIIVWFAFLTHGDKLDDLLGKGSLNNFSQWLT